MHAEVQYKLDYLEQPIRLARVPAQAGQQVAPEALASHPAWELKTLFAQQAEQELLQTVRDFHSCKQEERQSISSYVLKMKSYIDHLEYLDHPLSLNLGVSLILISLRKEFDSFMQNYNMHSMGKTVNELHAMLKLHEHTLTKKDLALHAILAGKPKIPPPPKRENPAKDSICHQCGDTVHWRRNCPQYLVELLKNKKLSQGASGSSIFTIELYTFPNKSWVYDTGCGTHIYNTTPGLKGSKKLKPGALSLYVGNGQRASVEAIGSYHLRLPSGLVIVLNNCHYAPSITRGIISVSRLYDGGYVNRFMDNTILVSRNNIVYFSIVPRDGIFEIDLSNSNTNDSSMYNVSNKRAKLNLDSALLWHCRLEHISKKRIEKLQHDGLLNSTMKFGKPCMGKTINELHAMLKLHEQTLTKKDHALHRNGKNKLAYAPKPKIPPLRKRENPAKDSIYHQCDDTGYWKMNCPQYLAELLKNKKLSQGASSSSIFTIELYNFPNKSWVYDTGNGQRASVEAIGSFHLCPPQRYAVPRDGIFEIDLSNSNTNDSSMYNVSNKRAKLNLDSALLWHCRLEHISKKRIEKLQHDGLLNSTNLRSFEKCVSCMSGKMARKPYTHQVERPKIYLD
ncbi:zinc finger, CCHC-type containing protein [Tanacetum coccineum]